MNKKGLLTTALVSTTLLSGLISPTTLVMASPTTSTNNIGRKTVPTTKPQLGENIYDQVIKNTTFDQSEGLLVLELTRNLTDYEAIMIREDTPTGESVGYGMTGKNHFSIEYSKLKYNHKYYIQYIDTRSNINEVELITNSQFTEYTNEKEYLKVDTITSDTKVVSGKTSPSSDVIVWTLTDDEYLYETKADEKGNFKIAIDKILPGRPVKVQSTGKYDSVTEDLFVQVGKEPVDNWFYNPTFSNNAKGWDTWGSDTITTPKDGYTNFVSVDNKKIGAIQSIEGHYGSLYKMTMDIRVNKFNSEEYKEIYLGSVLPGGGINPSFSNVTPLSDDSVGVWQTVSFTQPYFSNVSLTNFGFTIWGVNDADIKNISYTRIDR